MRHNFVVFVLIKFKTNSSNVDIDDNTTADGVKVETTDPELFDYYPLSDGTYRISAGKSKYLDEIVVSATYKGLRVTQIGSFENCPTLKTLLIPSSVTIPDSVTLIGSYAFADCISLTNVTIGNGVTSIGEYAFSGCGLLTSVTIGNGFTNIGSYAFADCCSLTSVTIPDNAKSIGDYAFTGCSSLTSVTIGNGVAIIGKYAFTGCSLLTSVTIPDSVTSIGNYTFYDCASLTSIYFKGTIDQWQSIDTGAGWENNVPETCVVYCSDGNISISQ